MVVLKTTAQNKLHFPVLRWIEAGQRYKIPANDTSLPQDDPFPDQRIRDLEKSKEKYRIHVIDPGLPVQVSQLHIKNKGAKLSAKCLQCDRKFNVRCALFSFKLKSLPGEEHFSDDALVSQSLVTTRGNLEAIIPLKVFW